LILLSSTVSATICYQETANVSTVCGGLSTGTYGWTDWSDAQAALLFDGDWDTCPYVPPGVSLYFYINYSKPANAQNTSLLMLKGERNAEIAHNYTIRNDCFILEPIQFRHQTQNYTAPTVNMNQHECWNGSIWFPISGTDGKFCEEGMHWNIVSDGDVVYGSNIIVGENVVPAAEGQHLDGVLFKDVRLRDVRYG